MTKEPANQLQHDLYEDEIRKRLNAEHVIADKVYTPATNISHTVVVSNRVHTVARAYRVLEPLGYEYSGCGTVSATLTVPEPVNPWAK